MGTDHFVVRQVALQLVEVIQQQHTNTEQLEARLQTLEARIAELEARVQQRSRNADRPPSSDLPYEQRPAHPGAQGKPGAKSGHLGHRQARLDLTEVIGGWPEVRPCGQRDFPPPTLYHTHQVIEMAVMHVCCMKRVVRGVAATSKPRSLPHASRGMAPG